MEMYVWLGVAVVVLCYVNWLARHSFSFGAFRYVKNSAGPGQDIFGMRILIHNREVIPLVGDYCIELTASEGGAFLDDVFVYAGCNNVGDMEKSASVVRVPFWLFPSGETWMLKLYTTKDCAVLLKILPSPGRAGYIGRILGQAAGNRFRIRSGSEINYSPKHKRPTHFSCALISILSGLFFYCSYRWIPIGVVEIDGILLVLMSLAASLIAVVALYLIRVDPVPISRGFAQKRALRIKRSTSD